VQPWDHPQLEDHLDTHLQQLGLVSGAHALDIGCGTGWFVRRLAQESVTVVGVECGAEQLRRAHADDPQHPDRYIDAVGQDLPFEADRFDAAFFVFSLHHVPESEMVTALHEAHRVVRPGGTVSVIEPVAQGLGHDVDALVDDETHVRAVAQAAVNQVLPELFVETHNEALVMATPYGGFAEYESVMVGVDPGRAETMAAKRDQVAQAFHDNAVEHDGRWWFEDHLLIRAFTVW